MLDLDQATRRSVWEKVTETVERFADDLSTLPVAPAADPSRVRALLAGVDFSRPMSPDAALDLAIEGLRGHQVHTGHPDYFGLFNPAVATMSVAADTPVRSATRSVE